MGGRRRRKEGGVNQRESGVLFQEIGCSRKVAITGARKLDMLVCRHSWEKGRAVGLLDRGQGEVALTTGVRYRDVGVECARSCQAPGDRAHDKGRPVNWLVDLGIGRGPGCYAGCSARRVKDREAMMEAASGRA